MSGSVSARQAAHPALWQGRVHIPCRPALSKKKVEGGLAVTCEPWNNKHVIMDILDSISKEVQSVLTLKHMSPTQEGGRSRAWIVFRITCSGRLCTEKGADIQTVTWEISLPVVWWEQ